MTTVRELIDYALNKAEDLGSRDDVVMDLSDSDLPEVETALIQLACDHSEEEMLIDEAGHSLWQIWKRQGRSPPAELVDRMHPSAKKFFVA